MAQPTTAQLILVAFTILIFVAGGLMSLARLRLAGNDASPLRHSLHAGAAACMYGGLACVVAVLLWHSLRRHFHNCPIDDNFGALIWLAALLAGFVAYTQGSKTLGAVDWFVMPIVVVLLIASIVFGRREFYSYTTFGKDSLIWVHWFTAYTGAAAFAVAAAGGAMYVISARRLRRKMGGVFLGSLERLERLMMVAVTCGFALLTITLVTGVIRMHRRLSHTKLLLAVLSWLVYAVVMHSPINPRFRGAARRC